MKNEKQNYYGSLCTEMYEILHETAPQDELDFYLSYAKEGDKIFEPLCGSGRFLIPFMQKGLDISGMDMSDEMLQKLKQKAPSAKAFKADINKYISDEKYDYIFISSGSVSLFTNITECKKILSKLKEMLAPDGKLVFAVDTLANRCSNDDDYKISISVKTPEGFDLILKNKNYFDPKNCTQYSPGIYELYNGQKLLQSEKMDFQTHLYKLGEMEEMLDEIGFSSVKTYSSYQKQIASDNNCEMFLYECRA